MTNDLEPELLELEDDAAYRLSELMARAKLQGSDVTAEMLLSNAIRMLHCVAVGAGYLVLNDEAAGDLLTPPLDETSEAGRLH